MNALSLPLILVILKDSFHFPDKCVFGSWIARELSLHHFTFTDSYTLAARNHLLLSYICRNIPTYLPTAAFHCSPYYLFRFRNINMVDRGFVTRASLYERICFRWQINFRISRTGLYVHDLACAISNGTGPKVSRLSPPARTSLSSGQLTSPTH